MAVSGFDDFLPSSYPSISPLPETKTGWWVERGSPRLLEMTTLPRPWLWHQVPPSPPLGFRSLEVTTPLPNFWSFYCAFHSPKGWVRASITVLQLCCIMHNFRLSPNSNWPTVSLVPQLTRNSCSWLSIVFWRGPGEHTDAWIYAHLCMLMFYPF